MAWKVATDPEAPAPPRVHSATRCVNCGHEQAEHDPAVGCLVDGGTKYLKDEESGQERRACSCPQFSPA